MQNSVCSANIRSQCFRQLFPKRANYVQWTDCYVSDVMCCLNEPEWAVFDSAVSAAAPRPLQEMVLLIREQPNKMAGP